jgi:hypothetical protein
MTARVRRVSAATMSIAAMLLAACESGPVVQEDLAFSPLQGEWIACRNDGAGDYTTYMLFFADASFRTTTRTYATIDRTCAGPETSASHVAWRYQLLGDVPTRIGPAGRDVVAKQMDIQDSFRTVYTLVYVDREATPAVLYFGDLALDPLADGTAPEKRPGVLSTSTVFVSP